MSATEGKKELLLVLTGDKNEKLQQLTGMSYDKHCGGPFVGNELCLLDIGVPMIKTRKHCISWAENYNILMLVINGLLY